MITEFAIPVATAVAGALAGGGLTLYGQHRSRKAEFRALVRRFQEPLTAAAFELQSRLWNVVRQRLFEAYLLHGTEAEADYCRRSTAWLFCAYLGWVEVLRRELEHLDFGDVNRNRELQARLLAVRCTLQTDRSEVARPFRIFAADQRAIGELMHDGEGRSLGYAAFSRRLADDQEFASWVQPILDDIDLVAERPAERGRLVTLQHDLIELLEFLDADFERYPREKRHRLDLADLPPSK